MPKTGKIAKILLCVLGSCVLALIITFLLHLPSMKVVARWRQPAGIPYDNRGPYYMCVVARDLDWRGFPLHLERNYFIYLGRDEGTPSYGDMIKYSFHTSYESIEEFLEKAQVQWTPEGVTLALPSGHRLFVPEDMFTGGR